MAKGRPKGSKSRKWDGYASRTDKLRKRYGPDVFKRWGKLGGNPVLLKRNLRRLI